MMLVKKGIRILRVMIQFPKKICYTAKKRGIECVRNMCLDRNKWILVLLALTSLGNPVGDEASKMDR